MPLYILGIETSCDETAAAIMCDGELLSSETATQAIHEQYGGVVPELASRAHQSAIVPVVEMAVRKAGIGMEQIDGIAYTRGPGLLGALMVGASFAKGLSLSLKVPLYPVHHMQAHIHAHFIEAPHPEFPFLCLTVSGGHTQIVRVDGPFEMEILGQTIDDAAGEAYDKAAKMMGLPYPGGPLIDQWAAKGNPGAFTFSEPNVAPLDFSFSGLKTSIRYFLRDEEKKAPGFTQSNLPDLCASIEYSINNILTRKLMAAARLTGISHLALAGGVAANSGLRALMKESAEREGYQLFIPKMAYCTDNAAMIAMSGHFAASKDAKGDLHDLPAARMPFIQIA
jgi:N6-L-threonylcarbamoyladenine synthase